MKNDAGNYTIKAPVQLEGVGTITMSSVFVKILRQINDLDCFKWAFLGITKDKNRSINMNDLLPHLKKE